MILYIGVYRPFKHAVSNLVSCVMESFLLAIYLECLALSDKNSDKSNICNDIKFQSIACNSLDVGIDNLCLSVGGRPCTNSF